MYIIIRLSNLCSLLCCFRVAAYDFIIKKKCSVYTFFNLLTLPYSHPRAIYISWEDFSECLSCRAGFLDVSCYGRDMDNVPPYVNHFIIKSIYIYEKKPNRCGAIRFVSSVSRFPFVVCFWMCTLCILTSVARLHSFF